MTRLQAIEIARARWLSREHFANAFDEEVLAVVETMDESCEVLYGACGHA